MSVETDNATSGEPPIPGPEIGSHPRGTLAIVGVYGLLFLIGWLLVYFFVFLPRGPLNQ